MDTWDWLEGNLGSEDGEKAPILQQKELTKDDVKDHIINNYTIDGPTFDDYYFISISKDKDYAFVEGPQNFDVKLSDGKITSKKY